MAVTLDEVKKRLILDLSEFDNILSQENESEILDQIKQAKYRKNSILHGYLVIYVNDYSDIFGGKEVSENIKIAFLDLYEDLADEQIIYCWNFVSDKSNFNLDDSKYSSLNDIPDSFTY